MTESARCYRLAKLVGGHYEHTMECAEQNLDDLRYKVLYKKAPVDTWPDDVTFEAKGTTPEDVPFSLWPLFSNRLRSLVESASLRGVTFHPVRLKSHLPVPIPLYWYAHFAYVTGAIDMDRSTYMYIDASETGRERLLNMVKFVLKSEVIAGWDLFRVLEDRPTIFCSQRFRELFIRNGLTGLGFTPVPVTE